ncbi:hypothetical protein AVEN_59484-1 [Araneus ventricosus]|uniref:Uncharacterized protein n=1 Tax=Araneus ventricosus TaxID=182803 RepID=A0A4Y2TUU0_ARAVE|nr:hypothetical protein AVEN_59484-1 [Araneus ventricosus]
MSRLRESRVGFIARDLLQHWYQKRDSVYGEYEISDRWLTTLNLLALLAEMKKSMEGTGRNEGREGKDKEDMRKGQEEMRKRKGQEEMRKGQERNEKDRK